MKTPVERLTSSLLLISFSLVSALPQASAKIDSEDIHSFFRNDTQKGRAEPPASSDQVETESPVQVEPVDPVAERIALEQAKQRKERKAKDKLLAKQAKIDKEAKAKKQADLAASVAKEKATSGPLTPGQIPPGAPATMGVSSTSPGGEPTIPGATQPLQAWTPKKSVESPSAPAPAPTNRAAINPAGNPAAEPAAPTADSFAKEVQAGKRPEFTGGRKSRIESLYESARVISQNLVECDHRSALLREQLLSQLGATLSDARLTKGFESYQAKFAVLQQGYAQGKSRLDGLCQLTNTEQASNAPKLGLPGSRSDARPTSHSSGGPAAGGKVVN